VNILITKIVSSQYFMVILGVQRLYALQIVQSIKGLHSLPSFIEGTPKILTNRANFLPHGSKAHTEKY